MKKTLSMLAVLGMFSVIGAQTAQAFDWSNLNPAYWGHCPRCEKKKSDCGCKKVKKCDPCQKVKKCDPCETGSAAPCDPCAKTMPSPIQQSCDPCDKLQNMNK